MSGAITVTVADVARSVLQSDQLNVPITPAALAHVIEIALRNVSLCALGRQVHVDLGNGYALSCDLVDVQELPPAPPPRMSKPRPTTRRGQERRAR